MAKSLVHNAIVVHVRSQIKELDNTVPEIIIKILNQLQVNYIIKENTITLPKDQFFKVKKQFQTHPSNISHVCRFQYR